jgi:transcriptional regulator with XRE-family HTH domain
MTLTQEIHQTVQGREAARGGRGARLRRNAGVTQAELARAIGVHPLTISRWERGQRVPRGPNAVAYARTLEELNAL